MSGLPVFRILLSDPETRKTPKMPSWTKVRKRSKISEGRKEPNTGVSGRSFSRHVVP